MKKYFMTSMIKSQTDWIEANYEWLKESYVRKGYDSKMLFVIYCLQRYEEKYLEFERKRIEQEQVNAFTHDSSF